MRLFEHCQGLHVCDMVGSRGSRYGLPQRHRMTKFDHDDSRMQSQCQPSQFCLISLVTRKHFDVYKFNVSALPYLCGQSTGYPEPGAYKTLVHQLIVCTKGKWLDINPGQQYILGIRSPLYNHKMSYIRRRTVSNVINNIVNWFHTETRSRVSVVLPRRNTRMQQYTLLDWTFRYYSFTTAGVTSLGRGVVYSIRSAGFDDDDKSKPSPKSYQLRRGTEVLSYRIEVHTPIFHRTW